jgi:hypothetical protein
MWPSPGHHQFAMSPRGLFFFQLPVQMTPRTLPYSRLRVQSYCSLPRPTLGRANGTLVVMALVPCLSLLAPLHSPMTVLFLLACLKVSSDPPMLLSRNGLL